MTFLRVLEMIAIALLVAVAVTQLLVPAWRGQKLFPMLRWQGKLEGQLADAVQAKEERKLKAVISKLKRRK